jgi:hypothetical protein
MHRRDQLQISGGLPGPRTRQIRSFGSEVPVFGWAVVVPPVSDHYLAGSARIGAVRAVYVERRDAGRDDGRDRPGRARGVVRTTGKLGMKIELGSHNGAP